METRRLILVLGGIAVVLVIVLGGLVASASLGGGDDGGGSDASDGSPTPETSPLPARVEGELRLVGPNPLTLDPACASDASSAEYIVEIFSGLVTFDRDLKLVPDIAEKWDVSDDGTVYTFHLRRGRQVPRRLAPGHRGRLQVLDGARAGPGHALHGGRASTWTTSSAPRSSPMATPTRSAASRSWTTTRCEITIDARQELLPRQAHLPDGVSSSTGGRWATPPASPTRSGR